MNLFQKRAALLKIAQVKSAMRHVLRGRMAKQAGTLDFNQPHATSKPQAKPKLLTEQAPSVLGATGLIPPIDRSKFNVGPLEAYPGITPASTVDATLGSYGREASPSLLSTELPEGLGSKPGELLLGALGGIRNTAGQFPYSPINKVQLPKPVKSSDGTETTELPDIPEEQFDIPGFKGTFPAWQTTPLIAGELKGKLQDWASTQAWNKIRSQAFKNVSEQIYNETGKQPHEIPDKVYRDMMAREIDKLHSEEQGVAPSTGFVQPYNPYDSRWTPKN